jgi:hypothetical protein
VTRPFLHRCAVGAVVAFAIAAPAAAADPGPGGAEAPEPVPPPAPAPAVGTISVDGPVAVTTDAGIVRGEVARFRGTARRRDARRRVLVQRFDVRRGRWVVVARTLVGADGSFLAAWRTDRAGNVRLRALLRPRARRHTRAGRSRARVRTRAVTASAELGVTIYRRSRATWYGPGFFGKTTACGQTLTEDLQGVAHRSLPCGTNVSILYQGRTLVVPVIDRGPYAHDADWDLTRAAAQALGMQGTDAVGAIALR